MIAKRQLTRFIIFVILSTIAVMLILWRYTVIMLSPEQAGTPSVSSGAVERGPILDRNGRVLAIQTQLDTVTAWMPSIENPETAYKQLISVLDLDKEELKRKFETKKGFFYVKRKISRTESRAIQPLLQQESMRGISLIPEYGRAYPEKELASHLIGYAGTDNIGLLGIEYTYDDVLYPKPGKGGIRYGNQLFLTIDVNLQFMLESLARDSFKENNPESITLLAADAKSGEILAYVSVPDFDPNNFTESTQLQRFNVPAAAAYEPGSVFKIFSIASFLDLQGITANSTFYCDGSYDAIDPAINCLGVHGHEYTADIIKNSCNVGAATASETVNSADFYSKLTAFGFGAKTGAPFPGEAYGILRSPANWTERTKPTIAMGQEISVSALQVISAATAFANGGRVLKPQLVKKVVNPEGKTIQEFQREPLGQAISPQVARQVLLMMETATLPTGTAYRAAVEGLRMSVKTGTAQITDPSTGRYSDDEYVASCIALFPTPDPQIIVYAVIHKPMGDEHFGGRIAAPLVQKASEEIVRYLGIVRDGDPVVSHPGRVTITSPAPLKIDKDFPDLTGRSKRDLMVLYQIPEADVEIVGEGWVHSQVPAPGTPVTPGMHIRVELE